MIKKCNFKDTSRKPPHRVKTDPLMHQRASISYILQNCWITDHKIDHWWLILTCIAFLWKFWYQLLEYPPLHATWVVLNSELTFYRLLREWVFILYLPVSWTLSLFSIFLWLNRLLLKLQAPEELCSRARSQQLELRFLRQLLQLHSATLQNIQKEVELLHAPDQKGNMGHFYHD